MKSETFKGKDQFDLNKQIWDWKTGHPKAVIKKTHSVEKSRVDATPVKRTGVKKIPAPNLVSVRVDYED